MLAGVEIYNFQSHKKTIFNFVPGTNVIIGMSDSGKSAAFRAINWVCSNRPLGDSFRSEWGGDTRVILHTTEGDVIERVRGDSRNEYIINGMVLKAFGSEVPEEVTNILRLDSSNIQTQIDPPFLLADTPGEAARRLNKAASIDDIDIAISGLRGTYLKIDNEIKVNCNKLSEYQEQLKPFEFIPDIEDRIHKVENVEKERHQKFERILNLRHLISKGTQVMGKLEKIKHTPEALKKWKEINDQNTGTIQTQVKIDSLKIIVHKIKKTSRLLESTENITKATPIFQENQKKYLTWFEKEGKLKKIKELQVKAERVKNLINKVKQEEISFTQEFTKLSPETCPLCGESMKKGRGYFEII